MKKILNCETKRQYPKRVKLGIVDGEPIYLSAPSWDCGWYWGFGYIGNSNRHYHIKGLNKDKHGRETNLHDGIINHFGDSFVIKGDTERWKFAELFRSFYVLKEVAEVYNRGGGHYTKNPCESLIKNRDEYERINKIVLPAIFEEIYLLIEQYIEL